MLHPDTNCKSNSKLNAPNKKKLPLAKNFTTATHTITTTTTTTIVCEKIGLQAPSRYGTVSNKELQEH